jgi:hypothetical protein
MFPWVAGGTPDTLPGGSPNGPQLYKTGRRLRAPYRLPDMNKFDVGHNFMFIANVIPTLRSMAESRVEGTIYGRDVYRV